MVSGRMGRDTVKEYLLMLIKMFILDGGHLVKRMERVHMFMQILEQG